MVSVSDARAKANKLKDVTKDLDNVIYDVASAKRLVQSRSTGEVVDSAVIFCDKLTSDMQECISQLNSLASKIVATAELIYDQELAEQHRLKDEKNNK